MNVIVEPRYAPTVHPLHGVLLAGALALFLGTLLSDVAYSKTFEIQWKNFSSWMLAGALLFSGVALVCAIVGIFRPIQRARGFVPYAIVLLVTWVVGFLNALMHARDAWASMPTGLVMSVITFVLACIATWLGFRTPHVVRTTYRGSV
ncbi:DUF2231 domain-containing protein [Bordetella sp. 15P40C-2]|uniref:DUF2231 domain-containing protein n=1 Tax=Bordetella sp. 15P40C-2 TaxID=2572246 RepID=UPI00132A830F|nr:hypothetical protein [Bordetella sp. 15P40C-2]